MEELAPDQNSARQRRRRAEKRRRINFADSIGEISLVCVVVISALAIGTVHIAVLLGVAALALLGACFSASALRRVPRPALVLLALATFCVCQALPLPANVVSHLSPVSADTWLRCLIPSGEKPLSSFPFTLDVGASLAEALKLVVYASVYVMASRVRIRRGTPWLATLVFGSASLVSLITLVHGVADLDVLYGFYRPNFTPGRWHVGPLLNSNNLAGYALLGISAGAGMLLSGSSRLPRLPSLLGLGAISTSLFLSGSRGGVVSAALAGAVVLLWLIGVQQFRFSTRRSLLGLAPFVGGIAGAFALGTSKEWADLANLNVHRKVVVWGWSLPLIRDHWLVGVGRGAFETAFPPYRQALDYDWTLVVSHAENFIVQWLAEWGVPVGACAIIVVVGYVAREWWGSRRDRLSFLLMTGLAALFVQNLSDLGLEVPAVAIAAVVALAAGERVPAPGEDNVGERLGPRVLVGALPAVLLYVGVVAYSMSPVGDARDALSRIYRELPVNNAEERAQFRATLRGALLSHPGEPFFPLLGSLVASRAHDQNPLPWVAHALELSPTNGRAHLVLAELLHSRGATSQAMLHLRYAAQYDRTLEGAVSTLAVHWAPSLDLLLQAVPDGVPGDKLLLDACSRQARTEVKLACLRRAVARNGLDSAAQGALADSLLSTMTQRAWPCTPDAINACDVEAERAIRAVSKLEPHSWRPGYLMATLFVLRGDYKAASQLLERVCPPFADGDACARESVSAAVKSGADDAIRAAASTYAARSCDNGAACADSLTWLASRLDEAHRPQLAVSYFAKAAEADPSASRWLRVADRAAQAQLNNVARGALERAGRSPDATPGTREQVSQMLQKLARSGSVGAL